MMGTLKISALKIIGVLVLAWISDTFALRDVQMMAPSAVKLGDTVLLGCHWKLEGNETLYSVKWYRGRQEFFSYLPKEFPFTRIFAQPGINVDVSKSTSEQVVLRDASRRLAGRYRCEVSADAPSFHTEVRSAVIHVVAYPNVLLFVLALPLLVNCRRTHCERWKGDSEIRCAKDNYRADYVTIRNIASRNISFKVGKWISSCGRAGINYSDSPYYLSSGGIVYVGFSEATHGVCNELFVFQCRQDNIQVNCLDIINTYPQDLQVSNILLN